MFFFICYFLICSCICFANRSWFEVEFAAADWLLRNFKLYVRLFHLFMSL